MSQSHANNSNISWNNFFQKVKFITWDSRGKILPTDIKIALNKQIFCMLQLLEISGYFFPGHPVQSWWKHVFNNQLKQQDLSFIVLYNYKCKGVFSINHKEMIYLVISDTAEIAFFIKDKIYFMRSRSGLFFWDTLYRVSQKLSICFNKRTCFP